MNARHPGRPKTIRTNWPKCKVKDCPKTTQGGSLGFCHNHYIYSRRGIFDKVTGEQIADFQRVGKYSKDDKCLVEGCYGQIVGRSLCDRHFQRWQKGHNLGVNVPTYNISKVKRSSTPPRKPGRVGNRDKWISKNGYIHVKVPKGTPKRRVDGTILEHRFVISQHIGRPLEDYEIVHHKDGNRGNNNITNLELMDGRARHGVGHPPGSEYSPLMAIQVLLQQNEMSDIIKQNLKDLMEDLKQKVISHPTNNEVIDRKDSTITES